MQICQTTKWRINALEQSSDAIIRKATRDDIEQILQIEYASFDLFECFSHGLFCYYLRTFEDGFFVALDASGSIVGYTILAYNKRCGYVLSIAVHPKNRHQGYAELLLKALEFKCHENHLSKLRLDVRVDNKNAIELYKKLGFVAVRTKKDFYGDGIDALMMEKAV
ncbi:MAG: ribosomal-protein-alanine N-acetyltransferase [Candidatus Bathyarchaeum sp.]|nr:MAG: ribosomal-protein-alanine N-acetyltransferase [Candidatus Bathyarchaeum sp.]